MIQVAVVGAGYWGPNIIRNFAENPACRLVAVCDHDPAKLVHLKTRMHLSVKLTPNYGELLNDPALDAIAIVTEIHSHFELAQAALLHDKHVFVEKPLAVTAEECAILGKLAEARQKVLMVGHTYLYNPAVRELKRIVDTGELGDIYYLHAQRLNLGRIQVRSNALWSLAVHDVSMALYLFGEWPQRVRAWGQAFITPGIEDVTFLNLHFPSGRLAHIHTSWLDPEKKRQLTLVGNRQMAVYDDVSLDRKLTLYDKGIDKALIDAPHAEYESFGQFQGQVRTGDVEIPHIAFSEPLKTEIQHFVDCIQGACRQPLTGWREGRDVVRVLEAAQTSLNQGGMPVEIDWQTESTPTAGSAGPSP